MPLPHEKLKPITSEEYLDINDSFWAHYGYFKNNFSYTRPPNAWSHWSEKQFIAPTSNFFLSDPYNKGVEFGCYEHVSVCVGGNADYILMSTDGEITYNWDFGKHNLENGWGYLPKGQFTRNFYNDYVLCCLIQKPNRPTNLTYNFEILTETQDLSKDVEFLHVACGNVNIDSTDYTQKQTVYNISAGKSIDISANSIAIIGYTIT